MPIQFGSIVKTISREAKSVSLPLPDLGAVTPSINLASIGEVTNGVANATLVPKSTSKVLSRKAETEALSSASHLHYKVENNAPQRAKSEVAMTSLPKSSSVKFAPRGGATRLTSPSEVNTNDEVISKSHKIKSLKARGLRPEQPRVSLVNTDLQNF